MSICRVVVMPTYRRPEMLALALERLSMAVSSGSDSALDCRIFLDHSPEERVEEVEYVRDTYFPEALIFHAKSHTEAPSGMWNILHAIKSGYDTGADRVYLVEEDVLARPNFFIEHERMHANRYVWGLITCGRRPPNVPLYQRYTNPGACLSRNALGLIVPHINDRMFADRRKYMDEQFGPDDEVSDLDDGLIRRIAKHEQLRTWYPDQPICSHIGFRAYNHYRSWVNEGTIQERIENLRRMLPTIDPTCKFTGDFEPI